MRAKPQEALMGLFYRLTLGTKPIACACAAYLSPLQVKRRGADCLHVRRIGHSHLTDIV